STSTPESPDLSAFITNGQGGAPANNNLFFVIPAGQSFATYAGTLLSNITTPDMSVREINGAASTRFNMGGVAFSPLVAAPAAPVSTWNGGATDNNWSSGNNWGGTAPNANNALTFSGLTRTNTNNDTAAQTTYDGLRFDSTAGSFTLAGNDIHLMG